jgi:CRISPR system Cascade subunit CasA
MSDFNLLTDPLIRVVEPAGRQCSLALPEVYAELIADRITAFPALRPHQRHAWHAFLVQIGGLALHRSGMVEPPEEAETWRTLLRGLTVDFPSDAPWSLSAPPDKPALLQPPIPEGTLSPLKSAYRTPDEIDMLVTAKNHDLKGARMVAAEPEDWLFALVQLQTCEGYFGAGKYGVSRMNGGYANRPGIGIAPPGGPGARVRRDIGRLLALRPEIQHMLGYPAEGGVGLVWLSPWDGTSSLRLNQLDPFYVEVCRRIRLTVEDNRLTARGSGSKVPRIAMPKDLNGITGDPWAPIDEGDGKERKALTVNARGFEYRRLSNILFHRGYQPAPLQRIVEDDAREGLMLICRALVRGEGKTEGLHERIVPISPQGAGLLRRGATDRLAALATERIEDAGRLRGRVLRYALMMLFQNGPDAVKRDDRASAEHAEPFLVRFDAEVDRTFFDAFWKEADHLDAADLKDRARRDWQLALRKVARDILHEAATGSPTSTTRHYRARARAESAFDGAFAATFPETRERVDAAT